MKSDEYMGAVDTALDIDGMDYNKVLELKTAVTNAEIDYFMTDILRAAHRAIIDNGITALKDYQSEKAVLPANAAKVRISNLIKIYPERFGVKDPEDFDSIVINVLVLSGGPEGLYLIADVAHRGYGVSRWMYPTKLSDNPSPDDPDGKVKITLKTYGASCLASTSDTETDVITLTEGSDFTAVYVPNNDCTFSKITVNDSTFTSLKAITSESTMSLAECNQGYKLILQNITEDTTIEFVCKYDTTVQTFRIDGNLVGCKSNCELPLILNEGASASVVITGREGYILSQLSIDGVDYTGLCNQGVSEFSHGKLTETQDDDYDVSINTNTISIKFAAIGSNHEIVCHYTIPSFMIVGAGDHVSIEPNPAEVLMSQDRVITLTPDEGYEITSIDCAVPFTENLATDHSTVITFENVTQDINYTVVVNKKDSGEDPTPTPPTPTETYYTITGYGENVSLSENPVSLKEGDTTTITITPDSNYKIVSVNTDYAKASLVQNDAQAYLQISNIDSDVTYTVRTAPNTTPDPEVPVNKYTITGTGTHVTLTPETVDNVEEHSSVPIIVKVEDGYSIKTIDSDATYVFDKLNGILTFGNVTANITYSITAEKKDSPVTSVTPPSPNDEKYTVTGSGSHVTINPNPIHDIAKHSQVTVKLTPDENYSIAGITTSEQYTLIDNVITFTDVKTNVVYVVDTKYIGSDPEPEPEKTYYTVTTNIGPTSSASHNIVVTSPELTTAGSLYTFKVEKDTAATLNLTSGYMDGNKYLTKMSQITVKATDTSETILTSTVNVSDSGTKTTNLEDSSGNIIGSIEATASENTYTYIVKINKVTQNISIAFGTTNVDIGQASDKV